MDAEDRHTLHPVQLCGVHEKISQGDRLHHILTTKEMKADERLLTQNQGWFFIYARVVIVVLFKFIYLYIYLYI